MEELQLFKLSVFSNLKSLPSYVILLVRMIFKKTYDIRKISPYYPLGLIATISGISTEMQNSFLLDKKVHQ